MPDVRRQVSACSVLPSGRPPLHQLAGVRHCMWQAGANGSSGKPRWELALLLLASLFVVAALGIAVSIGPATELGAWYIAFVLCLSIAAGGTVLAAAMAVVAALRRDRRGASQDEAIELRKNLLTVESIIKAEP